MGSQRGSGGCNTQLCYTHINVWSLQMWHHFERQTNRLSDGVTFNATVFNGPMPKALLLKINNHPKQTFLHFLYNVYLHNQHHHGSYWPKENASRSIDTSGPTVVPYASWMGAKVPLAVQIGATHNDIMKWTIEEVSKEYQVLLLRRFLQSSINTCVFKRRQARGGTMASFRHRTFNGTKNTRSSKD